MKAAGWTIAAQGDLARWDDLYRPLDEDYAERSGRAALVAGRFLAEHPLTGPVATKHSRKWRVRGFDAVLIYRIVEGGVQILRFHDARQNRRAER